MSDYKNELSVATEAAASAAEILSKYLGKATIQHKSATQDLVTQADVEAEETILRTIKAAFPDHAFLGEEGGQSGDANTDGLWVIDPLDGTTNFAHGIPQFCTSIAYFENGAPKVGVIHDPCRGEVFTAISGQGARLNDAAIRCSATPSLDQSVIGTGFYYDRGEMMTKTLAAVQRLFETNIRGIRRFGGAALDQCWVACGRFDGFFEYQLSPWDYAAGWLIIEEAGGRVTDRNGQQFHLRSKNLIAANAHLIDSLVEHVRWS